MARIGDLVRNGVQLARRALPNKGSRVGGILFRKRLPVRVTPDTALTISAVWGCVNYITGSIGQLPFGVYRPLAGNTRRSGGDFIGDHPVTWCLNNRTNPETNAFVFRSVILYHALIYGNGYAEIERDRAGRVKNLWLIEPDRVTVDRDDDAKLIYRVSNSSGEIILDPKDVFHVPGIGFDGIVGYPVIEYAARSMGLAIATEEYGNSFFGNSGVPSAVLQHPKTLRPKAIDRLKEQLTAVLRGPYKSQDTLILEEGMEYKVIGLPPEQAQFLETRKITVEDVCRWFGVPPSKIGHFDKISYNSAEQLALDVVLDCLMPWIKKFEQEADFKLLNDRFGGLYSKINLRAFMRATHADRAKYFKDMFATGAYSPNDIRELEDMNPIEWGDTYFVPVNNMAPLDKAAKGELMAPGGPKPEPTGDGEQDDTQEGNDEESTSDSGDPAKPAPSDRSRRPGADSALVIAMRESLVDDLLLIEKERERRAAVASKINGAAPFNGRGNGDRPTAH